MSLHKCQHLCYSSHRDWTRKISSCITLWISNSAPNTIPLYSQLKLQLKFSFKIPCNEFHWAIITPLSNHSVSQLGLNKSCKRVHMNVPYWNDWNFFSSQLPGNKAIFHFPRDSHDIVTLHVLSDELQEVVGLLGAADFFERGAWSIKASSNFIPSCSKELLIWWWIN